MHRISKLLESFFNAAWVSKNEPMFLKSVSVSIIDRWNVKLPSRSLIDGETKIALVNVNPLMSLNTFSLLTSSFHIGLVEVANEFPVDTVHMERYTSCGVACQVPSHVISLSFYSSPTLSVMMSCSK